MEIVMKVTVPDEDVTEATEKAPGPGGDLPEWLRNYFECVEKSYLRDLGLGNMAVQIIEVN